MKKNDVVIDETKLIQLEGLGFTESKVKPGLFVKEIKEKDVNGTMFWDFRRTKKGSCYMTDEKGSPVDKAVLSKFREYTLVHDDGFVSASVLPNKSGESGGQKAASQSLIDGEEVYSEINRRDDAQALQELQGGFMKEFVYRIPVKGREPMVALSYAGVKFVMQQMGNISVDDCVMNETDDFFRVRCRATDLTRKVSMFGMTEQRKFMEVSGKGLVYDPHALSKCLSRAQRNAVRGLIPEVMVKGLIDDYLKGALKGDK